MRLNVAYSSDDNYCKHLMVSMSSLLENNKEFSEINIYILSNGISDENCNWLKAYAEKNHANIFFLDFKCISHKLHTDGKFSINSFGRLFLGELICEDYVLYLDCDSVVHGSFIELISSDMEDNICCAVQDNVSNYYKKAVGLKKNDIYFNAGMLLIDLNKWRKNNMQDKAIDMINKFNGSVPHHDQGVINAICYQKIKRVHPKYNFQCPMFEYTAKELKAMNYGYYSECEIEEAKENPVFIHYTEGFSNRPWRTTCTHPNKDLYKKYQKLTPYKGDIELGEINKNSNILLRAYKLLPFPMYRLLLGVILQIKLLRK